MLTITTSQLRRLTVTILIGCIVLLPALIKRAPAQPDMMPRAETAFSPRTL